MSEFNPYHQWLGISETARPVSKYRLLAIDEFELDRDVISAAAERQTIYLRTLQAGEHAVLVADLLNEVSQARVTLLNEDQKAEYDEGLRKQQTPEPTPEPVLAPTPVITPEPEPKPAPILVVKTPEPSPILVADSEPATQESAVSIVQPVKRPRRRWQKEIWQRPAVIGVSLGVVIGVFLLLINLMISGDADPVATNSVDLNSAEIAAEIAAEKAYLEAAEEKAAEDRAAADKTFNVLSALAKGDWKTVLTLDPDNSKGLQMQAAAEKAVAEKAAAEKADAEKAVAEKAAVITAAVKSALSKGNWRGALALDPDNSEGLRMKLAAETGITPQPKPPESQPEPKRQVRVLEGHSGGVNCVAFSPDGKQIVSSSDDQTIKIWDAETGVEIKTLAGHYSSIYSVAFSTDGKRIVSGSEDQIIVWDANTGIALQTLPVGSLMCVAFSPDSKRIVSGGTNNTVNVWDVNTGKELGTLKGHLSAVRSVAFSFDGRRIVSGSLDNTIKIWNAHSGQLIKTITGHTNGIRTIGVSSNSNRIVSGSSSQTIVWDAAGKELLTLPAGDVMCVSYSLDGKRIISSSLDKTIKIWDANTGKLINKIKDHNGACSAAFSPNGKQIVSGSLDNAIIIWDVSGLKNGHGIERAGRTPRAREFVPNKNFRLFKTLKGHVTDIECIGFSTDGKQIVSTSRGQTNPVRVWDANTGQLLRTLSKGGNHVSYVAFSPNGKRIIGGGGSADEPRVWDANTGQLLGTLVPSGVGRDPYYSFLAYSPNGKQIISFGFDATIKVWDANTGKELGALKGHTARIWDAAYSPDGKLIVSASAGANKLIIWDANTGQLLRTFGNDPSAVSSVHFSPDGKRVVSLGSYGIRGASIKFWDANTGRLINTIATNLSGDVAFTPDGKQIVIFSAVISILDANTGKLLQTLRPNEAESEYRYSCGALSPVGKRIVSGSDGGAIKIWDASEQVK
jgi:WD40 repeat protein